MIAQKHFVCHKQSKKVTGILATFLRLLRIIMFKREVLGLMHGAEQEC